MNTEEKQDMYINEQTIQLQRARARERRITRAHYRALQEQRSAMVIQAAERRRQAMHKINDMSEAAVVIQSQIRGWGEQKNLRAIKLAAAKLQARHRG